MAQKVFCFFFKIRNPEEEPKLAQIRQCSHVKEVWGMCFRHDPLERGVDVDPGLSGDIISLTQLGNTFVLLCRSKRTWLRPIFRYALVNCFKRSLEINSDFQEKIAQKQNTAAPLQLLVLDVTSTQINVETVPYLIPLHVFEASCVLI